MLSRYPQHGFVIRFRTRKFLVLPEKKFKNRHREDLSMSRFINAKPSKSKVKVNHTLGG